MNARSLGIDEAGGAYLDVDEAVAHRISRNDALAHALASTRQQAETNPVPHRGGESR
jgi:hypothetical protein